MKIEAIDLFCGIGGLTYGLKKAGIDVLAGLDNDESCKYAYETNNNTKFICADIVEYDFNNMKSLYSKNSIKILAGCAPCQTFSSHSFKIKNKKDDVRWNMIDHFLRGVKTIDPDIISMENVRGITRTNIFKIFVRDIENMGYAVSKQVINCADYGIPQDRKRLVLLVSKLGKIEIPEKTHSKKHKNIKSVIGKLHKINAGETYAKDNVHKTMALSSLNIKRIKQSKPSGTWRDWDKNLLPECYKKESGQTYASVYGRMSWDKVAPTITTQFTSYGSGRFGHPDQNRAISIREGALLQTFPNDYDFGENIFIVTTSRHIGNAVPPELGRTIGNKIVKYTRSNF